MSGRLGLVMLAAGTLAAGACGVNLESGGHVARVEKQFDVGRDPEVHLITFDGSIEVRTWDRDQVLVEVEKRGPTREAVDSMEVTADKTGNRVQVEVRRPLGDQTWLGLGFHVSRSARIIATLPRMASVLARSGDGTIRIERVEGRIELRTGDGSVKGIDLAGRVTVDTGDGSITLQNLAGEVDARSGDGGISASGRLSGVRLRSGDGSVTVRAEAGSSMSDDWDISTGDGEVSVYLPEDFSADLDARTGDGRVVADHEITVSGGRLARGVLRGRLGAGGKTLKIRTNDGTIQLRVS
jgi:hypothetical protein